MWTSRCGGFRVSGQKYRSLRGSSASLSGAGGVSPGQLRPLCFPWARCCVNHGVFGQKSGSSRGARRPALSAPALLSSCSAPFRLAPHRTRLAPRTLAPLLPPFAFAPSRRPALLRSISHLLPPPRPRVKPAASLVLPSLRPASSRCPPRVSHPLAPAFPFRPSPPSVPFPAAFRTLLTTLRRAAALPALHRRAVVRISPGGPRRLLVLWLARGSRMPAQGAFGGADSYLDAA